LASLVWLAKLLVLEEELRDQAMQPGVFNLELRDAVAIAGCE
jgi:hypothetical protein